MNTYKLEPSECTDYTPEDNIDALDRYLSQESAEQDPLYWIESSSFILSQIMDGRPGSILEVQDMLSKASKLLKKEML